MPLQALYITEENLERLKKEENMSKIVNDLLNSYYMNGITPEDKVFEINKRQAETQNELIKLQAQIKEKNEKLAILEQDNDEQNRLRKQKLLADAKIRKEYDSLPNEITNKLSFEEFKEQRFANALFQDKEVKKNDTKGVKSDVS